MALSTLTAAKRRRFTVTDYHKMIEIGIFFEDDRVELIEGEIVQTAPMSSSHAACVSRSNMFVNDKFRDVAIVTVQTPVVLGDHSEPDPDLMLLRLHSDFYASALPTPADIFLLIEISDSSLSFDRNVKVLLYARGNRRGLAGWPGCRNPHRFSRSFAGRISNVLDAPPGRWNKSTRVPRLRYRRERHSRLAASPPMHPQDRYTWVIVTGG